MQKNEVIEQISQFHKITTQQINNLEKFTDLVINHNQRMNLIGQSTINDIWTRHILDSAQLLQFIDDKNLLTADIGSGAGFPGIILSILGIKNIYLIEKSPKKCQFLNKAKKISPNNITILEENITSINNIKFDLITSRAFAPLDKLLKLSNNLVKSKSKYLLLKGKRLEIEIKDAKKELLNYKYNIFSSKTSSEGRIIELYHKSS
ncbi:16S rRNA (guanine(527)-N(7))-methyltransferase RsmG [Rickettsiales bacterium]|nr:16S rRNA (guanine(527)-N(7))-methyltransferase RsmG [Rickettsiales bacterium]